MATPSTLVDRVKITVLSSGTGPFLLGPAVRAYRGAEALTDSAQYSYAVESGGQYEAGTGVYLAASNTLVRTPLLSSNGNAVVDFPARVELNFTLLARDILDAGGDLPIVQEPGADPAAVMSQNATTEAVAGRASLFGADFTLSGAYSYTADFFNPTDDYARTDLLFSATDEGSHIGEIRFGNFISAKSEGTSPNGPGNAFVGFGVSNIKKDFLTSTSTQETDGLFIQTKTGRFGDTSAFLADAFAVNDPGVSTSFANFIEGSAGCFDTSGTIISRIRFQAANQYQAGTPGTIEGVGCHIIAEIGPQTSAVDIDDAGGAGSWVYLLRASLGENSVIQVLGNGYVGINGIASTEIPLLVNAHPDGLTQRHYFVDDGSGIGPSENFFRESASPADNDLLGQTTFDGRTSGGAQRTFAAIRAQAVTVTDGSSQGGLFGFVDNAGTLVPAYSAFKDAFYIPGPLILNSLQVVGPRLAGWSADTGTAKRTTNVTYTGTAEPAYTQATIQTLMNEVRDLSQTVKALKDDLITHGLIGA